MCCNVEKLPEADAYMEKIVNLIKECMEADKDKPGMF